MISVTRFQGYDRIAGAVEKTASLAPWSAVSAQCR